MKVIGKTDDGFILEASKTETANLIGYYSEYDTNINIGDDLQVHEMYKQLYNLTSNKKKVDEIVSSLKYIINNLNIINPLLKDLNIDNKGENK